MFQLEGKCHTTCHILDMVEEKEENFVLAHSLQRCRASHQEGMAVDSGD